MKKKLLFLTVKFDTGGTEKVTYDIITRLDPDKYDITLMSMYGGGYYWEHLPPHIHRKYFFPKFIRYVIRYVTTFPGKWVYRTFIKEKYDVEIACGDDIPSRVINHSVNPHSKKIAWIHMDVQEHGYSGYEMNTEHGRKRFYRNFDKIVCVSKDCCKKFQEKYGEWLPVCVIYNPVPQEDIISKSMLKPAFVLPSDKFNIVCMGRFTLQKGFDRLLEALELIKNHGITKHHVTILGDGNDRKMLEKLIQKYALHECVTLAGYVDNPYPIIRQADLFVLTSRDESFSLAVAESMALGIPVMSTRCTGPIELLKDGDAGCLVENSTQGIYDGLYSILTDDNYYSRLQVLAKENTNRFHIAQTLQEVECLFDS